MANEGIKAGRETLKDQLRSSHSELSQFTDKTDVSDLCLNLDYVVLDLHRMKLCLEHLYKLLPDFGKVLA